MSRFGMSGIAGLSKERHITTAAIAFEFLISSSRLAAKSDRLKSEVNEAATELIMTLLVSSTETNFASLRNSSDVEISINSILKNHPIKLSISLEINLLEMSNLADINHSKKRPWL